ncbi:peptidyl-prolyl cis-trans isomerase isoform X2 [Wolffia australiana]
MRRRSNDGGNRRSIPVILLFAGFATCCVVYTGIILARRRSPSSNLSLFSSIGGFQRFGAAEEDEAEGFGDCCRGSENLELWGFSVKWGTDFRLNSSRECCKACKEMCNARDGPCLCNSWVFCGDREKCKEKFGECWLKRQEDPMFPHIADLGPGVMWTSGIVFGKGEGIIALDTDHGIIRIKLRPECAPHSMGFLSDLLKLKYSVGCHFYRAEPRGLAWDDQGDHIENEPKGPPYGLIQGTLAVEGSYFKELPKEACTPLRRGTVAWIGSGPEFLISLANHDEWHRSFTTFGTVVSEDMAVVEAIAELPTRADEWNGVEVKVLKKPVEFKVVRFKASESEG